MCSSFTVKSGSVHSLVPAPCMNLSLHKLCACMQTQSLIHRESTTSTPVQWWNMKVQMWHSVWIWGGFSCWCSCCVSGCGWRRLGAAASCCQQSWTETKEPLCCRSPSIDRQPPSPSWALRVQYIHTQQANLSASRPTHAHTHTLQRLSSPVILIMLLLSKSCNNWEIIRARPLHPYS